MTIRVLFFDSRFYKSVDLVLKNINRFFNKTGILGKDK